MTWWCREVDGEEKKKVCEVNDLWSGGGGKHGTERSEMGREVASRSVNNAGM